MIDIHSHIAWGLDDGMPSLEDARVALQTAKENGIECICSTPHIVPGQVDNDFLIEVRKRQREVKAWGNEYGVQIFYGAEMFMNFQFPTCLEEGNYYTLNDTKYLLCEFNVLKDIHDIPDYNDYLYEIEARELVPVIAHVERYFHGDLDWDILDDWKEKGYIFQVNRTSLNGDQGPIIQKNAWKLISKGYCHAVATDCHRSDGNRIENLKDVYLLLKKKYGSEYADLLVNENPNRILNGLDVIDEKPKKKGLFWRR